MIDDTPMQRLLAELRRQGIHNETVLTAMGKVPREAFVVDALKANAYENGPLPIGMGQTISQPYVVAMMTDALHVDRRMKVLEIGTGSGYQAAVLAKLCRRVYSVERHTDLLRTADKLFPALGIYNVTTRLGDGRKGWAEQAPFQRIIVTAAAPDIPPDLVAQLGVGGIMIIPVGTNPSTQELLKITRTESGLQIATLAPVKFVPLVEGVA